MRKVKRILSLAFPVMIVFLGLIFPMDALSQTEPPQPPPAILWVDPATATAPTCSSIDVAIGIQDVQNLTGFDLLIHFDKDVVEIMDVVEGDFLASPTEPLLYSPENNDGTWNTDGFIRFGMAQQRVGDGDPAPVSGDGDLIVITLQALVPNVSTAIVIDESSELVWWGQIPWDETSPVDGALIPYTKYDGTVTTDNCVPVADPQTVSTYINTPLAITLTGSDPDGDPLQYLIQTNPSNGVLSGDPPNLTYTPNTDFVGTDSFTFLVSDGMDNSVAATITIHVKDVPVAQPDDYDLPVNGSLSVTDPLEGVLANDMGPVGETLVATLVDDVPAAEGTLIFNADGTFSFTPVPDFEGVTTFTYKACYDSICSDPVTVTLAVKQVPMATADAYEMVIGITLTVVAPGVLGNDTGSTGATLTADLVTDVDFGALTLDEDGSFSYTPPTAGWTGTATFDYRACDGSVCSEAVSVTIEVKVRPTAEADAYQTPKNVTLNVDAINGVLNNDTGADGATLTAKLVTDVTVGTLTLNTDGSFEYIPQTDMLGSVPFTYQACDGEVCSEPVTVTIEVKVKPTAAADAYQTAKNATLNISAGAGVLSNDTGTGLHAELVTDVTVGTLTLNPDGSFEYIPATDMLGPVTFTYQACDGLVCSDSATVTITVKDTPVANDDSYWTFVDEALTVPASGVLENDTAPNSEPLHAVLVDDVPASAGTLAFESDGSFVFTPESGFVGMTTFTYRACYNGICSAPATVTIKVLETTCLVVDPESLEQSLYPNKTANQTLTITNTCDYEVPFELLETTAPLTTPLLLDEGFEGGLSFPIDWLRFSRGATLNTWTIKDALVDNPAHIDEGQYAAWITYDVANASDEWLLTLPMDVSAAEDLTLAFRAWSSTLYPGATMKVWVTDETGNPLTDEPLWDLIRDEDWADPGYRSVFVDLSAFDGYDTGEIRIAWQYVGQNGQSFGLDEVQVGARTEVPWLSQNPTSAVLPASGSTNITVTFDSTGMVEGDFFAAIFVQSEPYPTVQVPVIFHVLGEGLEYYFPLFRR